MKKILAMLGSLSLTTVASTTIISCGGLKVNDILITVGSEDFADGVSVNGDSNNKYSLGQIGDATTASPIPSTMSLAQLFSKGKYSPVTINNDIFNILTNSSRKIVIPNKDNAQLRNVRNIFSGRESYKYDLKKPESERYIRPSVDGVIIPRVEDEDKFYGAFETTSINSIEGLYRLANYSGTIGAGLTESKKIADSLFTIPKEQEEQDNNNLQKIEDAIEFAKLFTAEKWNPYGEAGFTKIDYNASKTVKEIFTHYETQATIFNNKQKVESGTTLTHGASGLYKTVNNIDAEKVKTDEGKRVYERFESDPFGRLILAGETSAPTAVTTLQIVDKDEEKVQPMIQLENSNTVYLYNNGTTEEQNYVLLSNQYYYQPVGSLDMTYHFNTDIRNNKGDKYTINFTLDNLSAVWAPVLLESKVKDGETEQRQIVWNFQGYKFSKGSGVLGFKGKEGLTLEEKDELQFEHDHRFQDFNISKLTIAKN